MAKTKVSDYSAPVWTVDPLLSYANGHDSVHSPVDNSAHYDSESGLCTKSDPRRKNTSKWSDNLYYKKRQYNGHNFFFLVAIFLLLTVLASMVTTVIYLAVGELQLSLQDEYQEIEEGMSLIEGRIRITNVNFTTDLLNHSSERYRKLSLLIKQSLDEVFFVLPYYNETEVTSFRNGSIIAQCRIHLTKPIPDATNHVGMAVIQALEIHHGYLPGGLLQVDIRSLHFSGLPEVIDLVSPDFIRIPGSWSEWTEWTMCSSPCEVQTRFRTCTDKPEKCPGSNAEMRNCPCEAPATITFKNDVSAQTPSEPQDCAGNCEEGKICIVLPQTTISQCLVPKDVNDPTGCGGWCVTDRQICKRLGNSTYQCTDSNAASCRTGEWQCSNGLCIPFHAHCDGHIDCYDMTDEINCECGEDHFRCGTSTPCLPKDLKCDGKVDCWDASDELNCTKPCLGDNFTCNNGGCINIMLFCDRYPDCPDQSDEPEGCNEPCLPTQKQCKNGRCVNTPVWCNGVDDCKDGSDEAECNV